MTSCELMFMQILHKLHIFAITKYIVFKQIYFFIHKQDLQVRLQYTPNKLLKKKESGFMRCPLVVTGFHDFSITIPLSCN